MIEGEREKWGGLVEKRARKRKVRDEKRIGKRWEEKKNTFFLNSFFKKKNPAQHYTYTYTYMYMQS
jgi:hypothetical protein